MRRSLHPSALIHLCDLSSLTTLSICGLRVPPPLLPSPLSSSVPNVDDTTTCHGQPPAAPGSSLQPQCPAAMALQHWSRLTRLKVRDALCLARCRTSRFPFPAYNTDYQTTRLATNQTSVCLGSRTCIRHGTQGDSGGGGQWARPKARCRTACTFPFVGGPSIFHPPPHITSHYINRSIAGFRDRGPNCI